MEVDLSEVTSKYFEKKEHMNVTELCHLMKRHDCDKGLGFHNYSTYYHALFSPLRDKKLRLLEVGHCKKGVSLPVWKEYFSHADIMGADIEPVNKGEIQTHVFNQKSVNDIHRLMRAIGPIDIMIDDGIHAFDDNWNLWVHSFPYLNEGGIYIVEDLKSETRDEFRKRFDDFFSKSDIGSFYMVEIPYCRNDYDNCLMVFQKKKKPEMVLVTAASENHSKSLVQFLCSLIVNKVVFRHVYVYDLGLDPATLRIIKDMFSEKQVVIRTFDYSKYPSYFCITESSGHYAWKPAIVEEVANEMRSGLLFWCDAGNKIMDDLEPLFEFMTKNSIYTPSSLGKIGEWTHPMTLEYFGMDGDDPITRMEMRNAAQICFEINPDTLELIREWSRCAQIRECIAPEGSSRLNHRQDQSLLSILFYRFAARHPQSLREIRNDLFVSIHQDID